jgi:hypothetical protein
MLAYILLGLHIAKVGEAEVSSILDRHKLSRIL